MNIRTLIIMLLSIGFLLPQVPASAAVVVGSPDGETVGVQEVKWQERMQRRQARWEKRKERLEARLENKLEKKLEGQGTYGLMDDDRFRIGLLLLLAGVLASIILTSWLSWIGGLAVIVGLVLMILAILDY